MFGSAGVLAGYGVLSAIGGAVLALAQVVPVWLAAFIVTAVLLAIAGLLAVVGRGQVRRSTPPVPEQAAHSLRQDVETVKEHAHR